MTKKHQKKFKGFIETCLSPIGRIMVAGLWVLGDTIEEIETNILCAMSCNKDIYVVSKDGKNTYCICHHTKLDK